MMLLVDFIDVTLAFEDVNSKLAVDIEDRVGNSLLQIWKQKFGKKSFCSDFEHFGQDFEIEVQVRF